jgi:hemerythrin superfamily protein
MPKRKTSRNRTPEALAMLIDDHTKVRKLFKQFQKLEDENEIRQLVEKACQALTVHAELEESVFYPRIREGLKEDDHELVDEAEVEHDVAKQLIAKLESLDSSDDEYCAAFTVLSEYVGHHIEEEENEMFKKVKRADIDFEALAQEMRERKQELMGQTGDAEDESPRRADSKQRSRASHRI